MFLILQDSGLRTQDSGIQVSARYSVTSEFRRWPRSPVTDDGWITYVDSGRAILSVEDGAFPLLLSNKLPGDFLGFFLADPNGRGGTPTSICLRITTFRSAKYQYFFLFFPWHTHTTQVLIRRPPPVFRDARPRLLAASRCGIDSMGSRRRRQSPFPELWEPVRPPTPACCLLGFAAWLRLFGRA